MPKSLLNRRGTWSSTDVFARRGWRCGAMASQAAEVKPQLR
jgi:hypothetical protein